MVENVVLSLRIPKALLEQLDLIAEEELTSRPELLRAWIRKMVREYKESGTLAKYRAKRARRAEKKAEGRGRIE